MVILRIKEVVPIVRDDEIAQFWHDDVRIVRGQNKAIHRRDINNLVNMWKTMVNTDSSSLPIANTDDETTNNSSKQKSDIENNEERIPLKQRNKSQIILARKLRNLQEFATAYNLNLSNTADTLLQTVEARENVQRMANDMISSINEANQLNLGNYVAQMGRNNRRSLNHSRIQTFYQELLDVMPPKWKEIFQEQSI